MYVYAMNVLFYRYMYYIYAAKGWSIEHTNSLVFRTLKIVWYTRDALVHASTWKERSIHRMPSYFHFKCVRLTRVNFFKVTEWWMYCISYAEKWRRTTNKHTNQRFRILRVRMQTRRARLYQTRSMHQDSRFFSWKHSRMPFPMYFYVHANETKSTWI